MKIIFLSIAFMLSSLGIVAQKHIEFLGIPLNSSYEIFSEKLQAKGFKPSTLYENSFDGVLYERQVGVTLYPNSETNTIDVAVYFSFPDETYMHSYYKELKNVFTKKYKDVAFIKEFHPKGDLYPRYFIGLKKNTEDVELNDITTQTYGTITILRDKVGEGGFLNQIAILYHPYR